MKSFILFVFALVLSLTPVHAKVTFNKDLGALTISGPTSTYQVAQAYKVFLEEDVSIVYMWGPGGLLYSGIQLGNLIKAEGATVVIPAGKACVSACGFAALGAAEVVLKGTLMVHRPYMRTVPNLATIEATQARAAIAYLDSQAYLSSLGYPSLVRFLTIETSPCKFVVIDSMDKLRKGHFLMYDKEDKCNDN